MSFPRYPAYKDSRVGWFGELPEHWDGTRPLKYVVSIPVTDGPHETPLFIDDGVLFISAEAVSSGKIDFTKAKFISQDDYARFSRKYTPRLYDIFMVKSGATTGITAINESDGKFNIWSPLAVIRCDEKNFPYFVLFALRSRGFQDSVVLHWSFGTQQNIGMGVIENLPIPRPPLVEQIQIARFLDRETAKIDVLIQEQQRLIELLKEKRQAVISQAVTKGLDPHVPMKDSGVKWLGEVPVHWETGALRWYATIQGGLAKGKDYVGQETVTVPYLRVANVQNGFVDLTEVKEISVLPTDVGRFSLRAGDVLMNEGGDNDKLGRGAVWQAQIEPCLHQNHVFAIRPNYALSAEWLALFTQSDQARTYFFVYAKQSTNLASISASNVMSMIIPLPCVEEQNEIMSYLVQGNEKYDQLINSALATVKLLEERRSALISAAVTGKIDVRGWHPPKLLSHELHPENKSCLESI